jgi:ribosome-associated heat shock protein Hsp15
LDRQRLDKWLWHARVVKARSSAATLVEAGDVLTVGLDRTVRVLKVTGFSERRGNAASARALYEDLRQPNLQKPDAQRPDL